MNASHRAGAFRSRRLIVGGHEHGVAVFRTAADGLRCEFSADGIAWEERTPKADDAGRLWPVCAGHAGGRAELFCADESGRLARMSVAENRISAGEPVAPLPSSERWYESAPELHDLAIVRDPRSRVYRAFFGARRRAGRDPERRGCVGSAASADLQDWTVEPPIFAPNRYPAIIEPRVFSDAEHTVLFYSTPEEGGIRAIRFAIAPRIEGPYERMEPDLICADARAAAHAVKVGPQRLVFFSRALPGETASDAISRPGRLDFLPDGRPVVRFYDRLRALLGAAHSRPDVSLSSAETLVRILPRYGMNFCFRTRVRSRGAKAAGVLFRASVGGQDNVSLWLEFDTGAVSLRRGAMGRLLARTRRALSDDEEHRVTVWAEGLFADVYLDDEWILSGPTEGRRSGHFGLTVRGGEAAFADTAIEEIPF